MAQPFKKGWILLLALLGCGISSLSAQTATVGTKLKPIKICDPSNNEVSIPYLGKKNLMIFYVDPDKANQNKDFVANLEKNQIKNPEVYGFGVVNLKDAPLLPNAIVRAIIRKKVQKTGAMIYTDPSYMMRDGWKLGDANDKFILIVVNKQCEITFISKGELSQAQIDEFYRVIKACK